MPEPALFRNHIHSRAIRLWHWITFIGFTASLITVLLGSTLFKTKTNIQAVIESSSKKGTPVSPEQAKTIAHDYSDKIWDLHRYIGIGLCFLFLTRILIEIVQKKNDRLLQRIHSAINFQPANKETIAERDHFVLVKRTYLIFYFIFFVMASTGLIMVFGEQPFFKSFYKSANSIHLLFQYGMYAYIFFHIAGVIRADLYSYRGIISGMIGGATPIQNDKYD